MCIMILIIGGAYQGKTAHAVTMGISPEDITDGRTADISPDKNYVCINNFHLLIKRLMVNENDPVEFTKQLLNINPDIVIISTEIGGGIVPIDRAERKWREAVGRTMTMTASEAEKVIRMVCGVPTVIKG